MKTAIIGIVAVCSVLQVALCFGQGPLTPPGAPAPIYKTLDQVEPRKPIKAADLPLTISQPGSYYFTENITFLTPDTDGISINSPNVSIDLMGFSLIGPGKAIGTLGDGIVLLSGGPNARNNVSVTHGTVTQWRGDGIDLFAGRLGRITSVQAENNGNDGIVVGWIGIISQCSAFQNGRHGFVTDQQAEVSSCNAGFNTLNGYNLGNICRITNSVAGTNFGGGIQAGNYCQITNCTAAGAAVHGIITGYRSSVTSCLVSASTDSGITVQYQCAVQNNNLTLIGNGIGPGIGIHVTGIECKIENNSVAQSTVGYQVDTVNNIIMKNTSTFNTSDYDIPLRPNAIGPIEVWTDTINSSNPYINFIH